MSTYRPFWLFNSLPFPVIIETGGDAIEGGPSQDVRVEPHGEFRPGLNAQVGSACFQKGRAVPVYVSTDGSKVQIAELTPGPGESVSLTPEMFDQESLPEGLDLTSRQSFPASAQEAIPFSKPPNLVKSSRPKQNYRLEVRNQTPFTLRLVQGDHRNIASRLLGGRRVVVDTESGQSWRVVVEGLAGDIIGGGVFPNYLHFGNIVQEYTRHIVEMDDIFMLGLDAQLMFGDRLNFVDIPVDANFNLHKVSPDLGLSPVGKEMRGRLNGPLSVASVYVGKGIHSGMPLFYLFVGTQGHQSLVYTVSRTDRPLNEGEAGLYSGANYTGDCWISNSYVFDGLNEGDIPSLNAAKIRSIKLGTHAKLRPFSAIGDYEGLGLNLKIQSPITESTPQFLFDLLSLGRVPLQLSLNTASQEEKVLSKAVPLRVLNSMSEDYFLENDQIVQRDVYRTTLVFNRTQKANGYTFPSHVEIYSDSTCLEEIEVFGSTYTISRDRSATVKVNKMGRVIITQKTVDRSGKDRLGAPTLLIRTDQMSKTDFIHVFPEADLHRKLRERAHDKDLWLNAKRQNGSYVVPAKHRNQKTCTALRNAVNRMVQSALYGHHEDATSTQQNVGFDGSMMSNGSWVMAPRSPNLPVDFMVVGEDISQEELEELHRGLEVQDLDATASGAIVHAIEHVVHVAVTAVGKEVHVIVKHIVNAAEKLQKFVVDTVEKLGHTLECIFKVVEVAIKDVIDFFKDIFEWKDIAQTASVFHHTVNDFLTGNASRPGLTHYLDNGKDDVNAFIAKLKKSADTRIESVFHNTGSTAQPTPSSSSSPLAQGLEKLEWILGKLESVADVPFPKGKPIPTTALASFHEKAQFKQKGQPTGKPFSALTKSLSVEALEDVISELSAHKAPTNAMQAIGDFLEALANTILDAAEDLVDDAIAMIKEGIEGFKDVINLSVLNTLVHAIPFIGKLFDFLARRLNIHLPPTSILTVGCFIFAVPVTAMSKIISGGHAPFSGTSTLWQTDVSRLGQIGIKTGFAVKSMMTILSSVKRMIAVGGGEETEDAGWLEIVLSTLAAFGAIAAAAGSMLLPPANATEAKYNKWRAWLTLIPGIMPAIFVIYTNREEQLFPLAPLTILADGAGGILQSILSVIILAEAPGHDTWDNIAMLTGGVSNAIQLSAFLGDEGPAEIGAALFTLMRLGSAACYGISAGES